MREVQGGVSGEDGDGQGQRQPAQKLGGAFGVALGERHGEPQARAVIHRNEQKHHRTAPVSLREMLSVPASAVGERLRNLLQKTSPAKLQ